MTGGNASRREAGRYRPLLAGGLLAAALLASGCGDGAQLTEPEPGSDGGESAADGSYLLVDRLTAPDLATMATDSELIAVGTVEGPPTYFENPRDDLEELPPELRKSQKLEAVHLRVDEVIKGEHRTSIEIVQDDLREIDHTDLTTLSPGSRVVVFLHRGLGGIVGAPPEYFRVFAVDQGVFDVGPTTIEARAPELFTPGTLLPATLDQLRAMVTGSG